jgi:hypothetical protein
MEPELSQFLVLSIVIRCVFRAKAEIEMFARFK